MKKKKVDIVAILAEQAGVADRKTLELYKRLHQVLSKEFGPIDSGVGLGGIDFQLCIDGAEYVITIKGPRSG